MSERTPTPRNLDPKFKEANPPEEVEAVNPSEETDGEQQEPVSQIVYRQQITQPDGTVTVKEHGPMSVTEWFKYAEKNGL